MSSEQQELNEILELISRWVTKVTLSNVLSYFDINKVAEGISQQLLNLIYGYELDDLNEDRINYPGIDLGDTKAGIAFQVTARTDVKKIKDTLDKYAKHELNKRFPAGVRFLIVSDKKVKFGRTGNFAPAFDPRRDILYAHTLVGETINLYRTNTDRYQKIKDLLQREFGNEPPAIRTGSLLEEKDPTTRIDNYLRLFGLMYGG